MTTQARYGSTTRPLPNASMTRATSTGPAPNPPSSSAKGRPSRPSSANCAQIARLPPPASARYARRAAPAPGPGPIAAPRLEPVAVLDQPVDTLAQQPLFVAEVEIHRVPRGE